MAVIIRCASSVTGLRAFQRTMKPARGSLPKAA
jgi:hypothetical protein